ncbi:MAG: hypothetical protein WDW38_008312 [Sanguina aurantia]
MTVAENTPLPVPSPQPQAHTSLAGEKQSQSQLSFVSQFSPGPTPTPTPSPSRSSMNTPANHLVQQLQRHGSHCMAQSTLQPGMLHFTLEGLEGYIAYANLPGLPPTAIILSDPVAPKKQWTELTAAFLKLHPRLLAFQVSAEYATVLSAAGLRINGMGGETEIDVQRYSYSGNAKRSLRQTAEWAKKAGVAVQEVTGNISNDLANSLRGVSESWAAGGGISRTSSTSTWFVNRLPQYEAEAPGVRTFVAFQGRAVTGFAVFDPMYSDPPQVMNRRGSNSSGSNGNGASLTTDSGSSLSAVGHGHVRGYYSNITRTTHGAHTGTGGLLIQSAMMVFRSEGVQVLSLGLSPLHNITPLPGAKTNVMVRDTFEWLYEHCNSFYPYQSLARSKSKYGASLCASGGSYNDPNVRWVPSFIATPRYCLIYPRYDLMRMGYLSGLHPPVLPAIKLLIKDELKRLTSGPGPAPPRPTPPSPTAPPGLGLIKHRSAPASLASTKFSTLSKQGSVASALARALSAHPPPTLGQDPTGGGSAPGGGCGPAAGPPGAASRGWPTGTCGPPGSSSPARDSTRGAGAAGGAPAAAAAAAAATAAATAAAAAAAAATATTTQGCFGGRGRAVEEGWSGSMGGCCVPGLRRAKKAACAPKGGRARSIL